MIRVVLDPNVLVSALLSPLGTPGRILEAWVRGGFEVVASPMLLAELADVLSRPKFAGRVAPTDAGHLIGLITTSADLVPDPEDSGGISADPGDDYLVALARAGGAHVLVSGDRHVAELSLDDVRTMTPREFATMLNL